MIFGKQLFRRAAQAAILVVGMSLVLGAVLGQPMLFSFVETGSMEPTLAPDDGFVVVPTALGGGIGTGDIVVFSSPSEDSQLTTHRVVGRTEAGFITKGDVNPFTDQQGGDPPVPRDRIVATAPQINGAPLVIPHLGAVVGTSAGFWTSVSSTLDIGTDPDRMALFFLVVVTAALLLDYLLSSPDRKRETDRSPRRANGYRAGALLVTALVLVTAVATASMALSSGPSAIEYDAVETDDTPGGGIVAGTSSNVSVRVANEGLVPAVTFLETSSNWSAIARDTVIIEPRTSATVNVTVTAPATPGRYTVNVVQHRYLGILPVSTLQSLHGRHPWVAIAAIDAALAVVLGALGRLLLGRGRVRFHRTREIPANVSARRVVRRVYR